MKKSHRVDGCRSRRSVTARNQARPATSLEESPGAGRNLQGAEPRGVSPGTAAVARTGQRTSVSPWSPCGSPPKRPAGAATAPILGRRVTNRVHIADMAVAGAAMPQCRDVRSHGRSAWPDHTIPIAPAQPLPCPGRHAERPADDFSAHRRENWKRCEKHAGWSRSGSEKSNRQAHGRVAPSSGTNGCALCRLTSHHRRPKAARARRAHPRPRPVRPAQRQQIAALRILQPNRPRGSGIRRPAGPAGRQFGMPARPSSPSRGRGEPAGIATRSARRARPTTTAPPRPPPPPSP